MQSVTTFMISDYSFQDGNSTKTEPFKLYKISDVNIYTDYSPSKNTLGTLRIVRFIKTSIFTVEKIEINQKLLPTLFLLQKEACMIV